MRAEELQCKDWILNNLSKTYEQVGDINLFEDKIYAGREENEWYHWELDLGEYEPIPITPEILDKNGWTDDVSDVYHISDTFGTTDIFYNEDLGKWDLDILLDMKCNKRVHLDIQYVHELQHALRLCKIEKEIEL